MAASPEGSPVAAEKQQTLSTDKATTSPPAPPADNDQADTSPATDEDNGVEGESAAGEAHEADEGEKKDDKPDPWQAVFSPEANAWYFWNSETQETTWTNPRAVPEPSEAAAAEAASSSALPPAEEAQSTLPGIDPELAWLDPSAAVRGGKGGVGVTQTARFNARTGRFQADPAMNPDRISDFQRGHRQQEAYFDVEGWESSLAGKGLKRAAEASDESAKKRPSTKQVDQFRRAKEEKKRKKLTSWLGS
ncbi:hypothetical protein JCM11251_003263 [Rhodosporidiobolus azoricus]